MVHVFLCTTTTGDHNLDQFVNKFATVTTIPSIFMTSPDFLIAKIRFRAFQRFEFKIFNIITVEIL